MKWIPVRPNDKARFVNLDHVTVIDFYADGEAFLNGSHGKDGSLQQLGVVDDPVWVQKLQDYLENPQGNLCESERRNPQ